MIRTADGDGAPYRRLLDLLAGWANYADSCVEGAANDEEREMYTREADAVADLYKEMGSRSGPYADLDRQATACLGKEIADLVVHGAGPRQGKAP